jgi:glutaminyl-tRNA synthetase
MEDAPPKYHRLKPGGEVRLMGTYFITCTGAEKGSDGSVTALHLHLRPGNAFRTGAGRTQGKGHNPWVSADNAYRADLYYYDRLFTIENVNDMPEWQNL